MSRGDTRRGQDEALRRPRSLLRHPAFGHQVATLEISVRPNGEAADVRAVSGAVPQGCASQARTGRGAAADWRESGDASSARGNATEERGANLRGGGVGLARQPDEAVRRHARQEGEARGSADVAHRARQRIPDIFAYAPASVIATSNPATEMGKGLGRVRKGRYPAVQTIEAERVYPLTRAASRLLALAAVRSGVLRLARDVAPAHRQARRGAGRYRSAPAPDRREEPEGAAVVPRVQDRYAVPAVERIAEKAGCHQDNSCRLKGHMAAIHADLDEQAAKAWPNSTGTVRAPAVDPAARPTPGSVAEALASLGPAVSRAST